MSTSQNHPATGTEPRLFFPRPQPGQPMDVEDRYQVALDKVKALLRAGEVLAIGYSGGKDSSAVLNICLVALLELKREGIDVPRLYVTSANTLIENPAVDAYLKHQLVLIEQFAQHNELDVEVRIATPNLLSTWQVRVISGRAIPIFANKATRDCSVNLKIDPQTSVMSAISRELRAAGKPAPIRVLGTRLEESSSRNARMRARGDLGDVVEKHDDKGAVISRSLSLIAEWSQDDVWEYLGMSGAEELGFDLPGFKESFADTRDTYRDAEGECPVTADGGKSAACGARFGCALCTVSGATDRSMETMLNSARYAYMRGLNQLRNWLVNTQYDWTKRRWVGRRPHELTGCVPLHPNNYSPQVCDFLLRACLTLDARERDRAAELAELVAAGREKEDAGVQEILAGIGSEAAKRSQVARYLDQMVKPQFQLITREMLVTIDFLWSADAMFAPFHALAIAQQVWNEGRYTDIPEVAPVPPQPMPVSRYLQVQHDTDGQGHALVDDIWRAFTEGCGLMTMTKDANGDYVERLAMENVPSFTLHEESLDHIQAFEWERLIGIHDDFERGEAMMETRTYAFSWYLTFGAVAIAPGARVSTERMARRGRMWERQGLAGDIDGAALHARSMSKEEHAELVQRVKGWQRDEFGRVLIAAGLIRRAYAHRLPSLGAQAAAVIHLRQQMRDELPQALASKICAESYAITAERAGRPPVFDGIDQGAVARDAQAVIRRWEQEASAGAFAQHLAPLYRRLVRRAYTDAITLVAKNGEILGSRTGWALMDRGFRKLYLFSVYNAKSQIRAYRAKLHAACEEAPRGRGLAADTAGCLLIAA